MNKYIKPDTLLIRVHTESALNTGTTISMTGNDDQINPGESEARDMTFQESIPGSYNIWEE